MSLHLWGDSPGFNAMQKGLMSYSNSAHFSLFKTIFIFSFLALYIAFELRFSLIQCTFGFPSDTFQTVELWDLTSNMVQCIKLMKSVLKWRARQNNYLENVSRKGTEKISYSGGKVTETEMAVWEGYCIFFIGVWILIAFKNHFESMLYFMNWPVFIELAFLYIPMDLVFHLFLHDKP